MAAAAAVVALLPSCSQMSPCGTETVPTAEVILEKKNFRVVAARVSGEDAGFTILPALAGLSRLAGSKATALPTGIPVVPITEAAALDDLYKKSGLSNPNGRALQLINVSKEIGGYNAIIFGRPIIRITGDLIEFTSSSSAATTDEKKKR